jgi:inner membrane transporter RhtA
VRLVRAERPPARGGSGLAVLMVLGSCTSLQVGAACAAQLFPRIGSLSATFLRLLIAAVLLIAATRPDVRRWHRRQWGAVAVFGLSLAAMNGSFYESIARIPLGTAVTIEFLGPLTLAAVLSRRLRDLTWVALAALGVALLGLAGSGGGGSGGTTTHLDLVGVAFALVAGVFWAGYILASAKVGATVPGQGGLAVALAVGSLALLPLGGAGALQAVHDPRLLLLAAGTGVLASVIPYTLELSALRRLPAPVFGVLLSLEPAIAATAGWLLLGQRLGAWEGVAVGVVVLASVGSTLTARRTREEPDPVAVVSPVAEATHPVLP